MTPTCAIVIQKLKNCLLNCKALFLVFLMVNGFKLHAQIANYVSNGSLEEHFTCDLLNPIAGHVPNAKGWDEIYFSTAPYCNSSCLGNVPLNGFGFQYPKNGDAYAITDFFILNDISSYSRTYLRNHLKSNLISEKTYCAKFYVNNVNGSSCGINRFQAYFGDSSLDTIKYAHMRLTYLNPQIKSPVNYILTDTLNWVPITGTFTANGSEKYMVIGNFETDASTAYSMQFATTGYTFSTINIDYVSCIPIDIPAYAGSDKSCIAGDSVFIGRTPDVEIDESCIWYKLNSNGTLSAPIDTVAGIYVKPSYSNGNTESYVVRQQLWCSGVKWDTVTVYRDFVGLSVVSSSFVENNIRLFPNPSNNSIRFNYTKPINNTLSLSISNVLGEVLLFKPFFKLEEELNIAHLPSGLYQIKLENAHYKKTLKLLKE